MRKSSHPPHSARTQSRRQSFFAMLWPKPIRPTLYNFLAGLGLAVSTAFPAVAFSQEAAEPGQAVVDPLPPQPAAENPATGTVSDDPAIPELPETIVPGQTNPATTFPSQPLNDDTLVSPNRIASDASKNASSITVITQEEIQRSGKATVSEVLRGTLGVDVVQQGSQGGVTSVFMRGANSQHTKVILDGMPLNDPSNASRLYDFSNLTVDNIERIEVLRGPQSMVYGSDAIGGVINIVTKRGQGPLSVKAAGSGGSFNTVQSGVNLSGGNEKAYYSFSAGMFHTGGISSAAARLGNTEKDPYTNGTYSGRFGYNLTENWNADYVFRYIDAVAHVDDYSFALSQPVDNLIRKNLTKNFSNRVQLTGNTLDGLLIHKVGFSLIDYNRLDTDPGLFTPPLYNGQTREVDYTVSALLTENNTLTAGGNYLAENASSTFDPNVTQNIKGAFVQDGIQIGQNWYSTVGVRWDDASRAGTAQTYRATSLYNFVDTGSQLHGTIGTGFRQPALAENLFAFGNPNLRPERSKGWDVGWRQQLIENTWWFDATYYRNDFQDLIVFDFTTFALENVGQARSSGVELTSMWTINDLNSLSAGYTLDDTLNLDTGTRLLRRPRDKWTLGYTRNWMQKKGSSTLQFLYFSDRLDTGNQILPSYALLNLNNRYQVNDRMELTLRFDNITDTKYEQVYGYGSLGFGVYGGASLIW